MIRIYLDWNVISSLKKPEFQEIREFIDKHKQYLQFPYSPAHFTDLMKSYGSDNKYFNSDLETLEYLSGKHHIRWDNDRVKPLFGKPKEFFEGVKDNKDMSCYIDIEKISNDLDESFEFFGLSKFGTLIKSLLEHQPSGIEITEENRTILKKMFPNMKSDSSMWDLMRDFGLFSQNILKDGVYYKNFRRSLAEQGFKLDANSGNWNYDEVIKNIDDYLFKLGVKMNFLNYVETSLIHKNDTITLYEFYISAYLMLDMIGYKADKLPKPTDNMQNIQTDGEHSFYGGHCDYFVAMDKKLRVKSKVLYNEYNIDTKIIEPKEFIHELEKVIDPLTNSINFIQEAINFCKKENFVESYVDDNNDGIESFAFKLPRFYFNFFNYVLCTYYPEQGGLVLSFRKTFKNFSRFIFYSESETLIDYLCEYYGYENNEEFEYKKNEFVYEDKDTTFDWKFDGVIIRLEKDEDSKRPILSYIISTKHINCN